MRLLGWPQITLGLPNFSPPKIFLKCLQNRYILHRWMIIHEEGPTWVSRNFFHTKASKAIPSNAQGSKNWMFISNFAAWFFMASILAALKQSWSSNNWTLIAEWSTPLLNIWSSRAFICYILASSSWYHFCNISTKESLSGKASSLCLASIWHRL